MEKSHGRILVICFFIVLFCNYVLDMNNLLFADLDGVMTPTLLGSSTGSSAAGKTAAFSMTNTVVPNTKVLVPPDSGITSTQSTSSVGFA